MCKEQKRVPSPGGSCSLSTVSGQLHQQCCGAIQSGVQGRAGQDWTRCCLPHEADCSLLSSCPWLIASESPQPQDRALGTGPLCLMLSLALGSRIGAEAGAASRRSWRQVWELWPALQSPTLRTGSAAACGPACLGTGQLPAGQRALHIRATPDPPASNGRKSEQSCRTARARQGQTNKKY